MTRLLLLSLAAAPLVVAGCKKAPPEPMPLAAAVTPREAATPAPPEVQRMLENFRRVHFEYDSARLTADSRRLLDENAALLQKHPDVKVEVQGHCDERGTTDYNLALGNGRAAAVKNHLVTAGVKSDRVAVVSYGEERPLAAGATEQAFSQNRRAEFRVTWGGDGIVDGTTR